MGQEPANPAALEWDIAVPLLTNRHMLAGVAKAMFGAALGLLALVSLPLAVAGEWDAIGPLAALLAMIGTGLFALSLLVMLVPFGNRLRVHYRIDADGVEIVQTDRTAHFTNRAAFWMGLVLGRPGAAGTGALAIGQEQQALAWRGAFSARYEPGARCIALSNGWRTLMRIYCLPGNYDAAAAIVASAMERAGTARRIPARSPLSGYLWRTVLVVAASLPLLALAEEFDTSAFTPYLMLCFALAMVWLVRPLAWVVLAALGWMALELAASLSEQRHSMFGGGDYLRYEVIGGDGWGLLLIGALAALVLAWLAIAILRGRVAPALTQDMTDGGDV